MLNTHNLAIAAAFALGFTLSPVQAAAKTIEPVLLETVVVTPIAHYTAPQWQARVATRHAVAAVTLEPVIVTPTARYTLTEWQRRQSGLAYVKHETKRTGVRAWLNAVWKHFQFKRSPVEV